jgi:hypothetical protein
MFEEVDYKKNGLDIIKLIVEFYFKNERYPSHGSKNIEEKRLGLKLHDFKLAKKGRVKSGKWYHEYEESAIELGCHNMFKEIDILQNCLESIRQIAVFFHYNGRYPKQQTKNDNEKMLGQKRSRLKQAKKGNKNFRWYPEYESLAIELGCPDMFEEVDYKQNSLDAIRLIAEFYLLNDRYPSQHSKDTNERRLGQKRSSLKQAKKGIGNRTKWYPEYEKLAIKLKCPDMFKIV